MTDAIAPPLAPRTPLKERHRAFVEAYLTNGGNATDAAGAAGFAGDRKVLAVKGSQLLAREDVQAALKERADADPKVADRIERQRWWTRVMRADGLKVPMKDRMEASKLLARSQGDFVEKHEVKHTGQVVFYIPKNGREAPDVDEDE